MTIYEEQIKERIQLNNEAFEDASKTLEKASKPEKRFIVSLRKALSNKDALDYLLGYTGASASDLENLSESDVIYREVELSGKWWKKNRYPIIARSESGEYTVLIPGVTGRYFWLDNNGKRHGADGTSGFSSGIQLFAGFPQTPVTRRDFLKYLREYLSNTDIVLMSISSLIAVALGMVFPQVVNRIMTHLENSDLKMLFILVCVVLCSELTAMIFRIIGDSMQRRFVDASLMPIKNATMMRILQTDITHSGYSPVDFWRILTMHIDDFTTLLVRGIVKIPLSLCFFLAFTIQSFFIAGKYTWIIVAALIVYLALTTALLIAGCKDHALVLQSRKKEDVFDKAVIDGIDKIRQTYSEKRIFKLWSRVYSPVMVNYIKWKKHARGLNVLQNLLNVVPIGILVIVSIFGGFSSNLIVILTLITGLIYSRAFDFSNDIQCIFLCDSEWNHMKMLFENDLSEETGKQKVSSINGSVSVDNLSLSYPDDPNRKIIDDISFSINPGEYVGIVGLSGSGKSTLLKLLLGMETPTRGSIRYGRHDLSKTDRISIMKNIGIVLQNDRMIPGSIRQNMILTGKTVTEKDIWNALEAVGIADQVRQFSYGLDTRISGYNAELSGGQIQRLLIARAIVSKPKMLIFDEATSALDNISQRKIKEILDGINATRIVVAHRLSTVRDCDRILVLDKGKIVEQGDFDTLIKQKGLFYELSKAQLVD